MISGLEHVALNAPKSEGAALEAVPVPAYRPTDSAHKVRWSPPPPGF